MTWPKPTESRLKAFKQFFQEVWIAGTVGAFFMIFIETAPLRWREAAWPPDALYTWNVILRYAFLAWFLVYFFLSHLTNTRDRDISPRDLAFDVIQSTLAFASGIALDLVAVGSGFGFHNDFGAFATPLIAVCALSSLALLLFCKTAPHRINRHRLIGVISSAAALVLSWFAERQSVRFAIYSAALGVLWLTLLHYGAVRLERQEDEQEDQ